MKQKLLHVFFPKIPADLSSTHYLFIVHQIITSYLKLTKPHWKKIFEKRFLHKQTLQKIGIDFNLTRERVRQITDAQLNHLTNLLRGNTIKKPHCCCNKEILTSILNKISSFEQDNLITKADIITEAQTFIPSDEQLIINYIDFLLPAFNYTPFTFSGNDYFLSSKVDLNTWLNEKTKDVQKEQFIPNLCKQIEQYLLQTIIPVPLNNITTHTHATKEQVLTALKLIDDIEETEQGYQISINKLRTFPDRVYRILHNNTKPMHFSELGEQLNTKIPIRQCCSDPRFKAIGKSGFWSLSSWHLNSDTLISLVTKSLEFYNRPATYSEITKLIKNVRNTVTITQIKSLVRHYPNLITLINLNTIALKSWNFQPYTPLRKNRLLTNSTFNSILIESISNNTLSANSLAELIHKKIPTIPKRYLILRFYSSNILDRIYINDLIHFKLKLNYSHILNKKPKFQTIIDLAISALKKKPIMRYRDLILLIHAKGYNPASIYTILTKSKRFNITLINPKGKDKNISLKKQI